LNLLALIEFAHPHQMATEMDSITIRFDRHYWMPNKMEYVIAIRFGCYWMEIEKKEKEKPLSTCFSHSQGWVIKKNMVTIQLLQFLISQLKFFNC
jgi:hypothetical protein